MAITDKNTVLVLGAGTSAPFGLPLGGGMISDLSEAIKQELEILNRMHEDGRSYFELKLWNAARGREEFSIIPIHGTVAKPHMTEGTNEFDVDNLNNELEKIENLEKLLDNQTSETIDDFIFENPSYAQLTKIGIAASFMKLCYDFGSGGQTLKPLSERFHPPKSNLTEPGKFETGERNWVHLLINIVRQGIRSDSVSANNKVQIVTFNYDKILEYVLEKQFSNTEAAYDNYREYIDIIHVHGECGDLSDTKDKTPAQICLEWANGIHVVHENVTHSPTLAARQKAVRLIKAAKEIYFCGFSFAGPNCRLLELDEPNKNVGNRTITYCNYDGNIGISKSVEKFEDIGEPGVVYSKNRFFTYLEENSGSRERPLGIADWLKLGSLGELP